MVTCFVLAGQIVLSLSTPLVIIEDDGTEVDSPIEETIIFPKDAGVHIADDDGEVIFEFFENGQKQDSTKTLSSFLQSNKEVVAALSNCKTD